MSEPAPGWYPNPDDTETARFWDGAGWTEQVRPSDSAGVAAEKHITTGPDHPAGGVTGGAASPSAGPVPPPPPPPADPGADSGPSAFPTAPPPMPPPPATGLGPDPPEAPGVGSPYLGGAPYPGGAFPASGGHASGGASGQDGMAIFALVLGIVAYPLLLLCWLLAIPTGIAAIVVGIVAVVQANGSVPPRPKGMAIAGIALGAGALLLGLLLIAWLLPALAV